MTPDNLRQMQSQLYAMRQQLLHNSWQMTAALADETGTPFEICDVLRRAGKCVQKAEHAIAVALWEYDATPKKTNRNGPAAALSDEPDSDGGEL